MQAMKDRDFSRVTPAIETLANEARVNGGIDPALYDTYSVKRGLRDLQGNGVLTGLTEISEVHAKEKAPDGTYKCCYETSEYLMGIPLGVYGSSIDRVCSQYIG